MKKMFIKSLYKGFLYIGICFIAISCNAFKPEYETVVSSKEEFYAIDPSQALNRISQGENKGIFIPQKMTQADVWTIPLEKTVQWKQDDYFLIAKALNIYTNGEDLDRWSLSFMDFSLDCSDIGQGFQMATLRFFKVENLNNSSFRTTQHIEIMPRRNLIRRYEADYSPVIENWETIDLTKINISASEAINIVENNGGKEVRGNYGNKCYISLTMAKGSGYHGWDIAYTLNDPGNGSNDSEIFRMYVDPSTGAYKVIEHR